MGLDAVSLLIIVGEVEKLQRQVRPDAVNSCGVELTNVDNVWLETQDVGRVHILSVNA